MSVIPEAVPKQAQQVTKRSDPIEAAGANPMKTNSPPPGSTKHAKPLEFEGLGSLADFPETVDRQNVEGEGTYCVVLTDILAGADGETYTKGQVHRVSKLVPAYFNDDKTLAKASIKRLVGLNAIRHATPEEIASGFAEVTSESESESTQRERNKRLELESENEALRRKLSILDGTAGQDPAPPGTVEDPFSEG